MRSLLVFSLVALVALPVTAQQGPMGRMRAKRQAAVEEAKATWNDKAATALNLSELSRFIGALPDRCEALSEETRLCSWTVGNKLVGYSTLAEMVGTRRHVNVICALPNDDSARDPQSCTAVAVGAKQEIRW